MKNYKLFIVFLSISVSLEANYCIQVLTTNSSEQDSVVNIAASSSYNQFSDIRVETRGRYLVFRVGEYASYNEATQDVREIKKINKDAYIRKCDFEKDKAIYIKNEKLDNSHSERVFKKELKNTKPVYTTPVKHKRSFKEKRELNYSQVAEQNLWKDCQKCFIPMYEEENFQEIEVTPKKVIRVKENREIEVRMKNPVKEESFWAEDITENDDALVRKSRTNKYDINEQFLP